MYIYNQQYLYLFTIVPCTLYNEHCTSFLYDYYQQYLYQFTIVCTYIVQCTCTLCYILRFFCINSRIFFTIYKFGMNNVHCTMYLVHFASMFRLITSTTFTYLQLYSVQWIWYNVHYYSIFTTSNYNCTCTLYYPFYSNFIYKCTMYIVQCTCTFCYPSVF